jgi:3-hydroxyisobutyrate dehydrogenase
MSMTTCGFIGLGSQGAPMARRMIDAGYPVVLWARRPESLAPFSATTVQIASSVADLGARVEHAGICVVDDAGVRQVCDELIPAMSVGSRIAIHSTIHPDTVTAVAKQAAARGITLIDAPVSGGGQGAAAGTLTVMVGCDEAAFAAARPIFASFGGLIVRVGNPGAGQMAKLVNNALMAANMAMSHYALTAATNLGLDRTAIAEIVKVSSGRSFGFDVYARQSSPSAFSHGAKLLAKDVRLLGDVLGADPAFIAFRDVTMPFLDLVQQG